jgi:hypothetical protein
MKTVTLKLIIDDKVKGTADIDATQDKLQVFVSMGDVASAFINMVEEESNKK